MNEEEGQKNLIQCWTIDGIAQLDKNNNYMGCFVAPPLIDVKPKQDG